MAEITVLCEHLQAPSMCKDCRIARLEAEVAALKAQAEPTKQERVAEILRSYNDKSGSTEDIAAEIVAELEETK